MSRRSWSLVGLVLGGGILLQIPSWGGHAEHHAEDGHDHGSMTEMLASAAAENPGQRTVTLEVTGMTWTGCATAARLAVNRVQGVIESEFSYERGSGVVIYNPAATDPETFITELLDRTGFRGRVVESPNADPARTPADGYDGRAEEHDASHSNR